MPLLKQTLHMSSQKTTQSNKMGRLLEHRRYRLKSLNTSILKYLPITVRIAVNIFIFSTRSTLQPVNFKLGVIDTSDVRLTTHYRTSVKKHGQAQKWLAPNQTCSSIILKNFFYYKKDVV